jgi:diguanylate cyclase (GGDEF)-like protein/PAS domain S-box-containing protein
LKSNINTENRINSVQFYELAEVCNNVLFWESDKELNITYINRALLELTGFKHYQIIGKNLKNVLDPDNIKAWQQIIQSSSTYQDLRFKLVSNDGQVSHLIASGKAIIKKDKTIGYYGICTVETKDIITKKVIKRLQSTRKTLLTSTSEALIIIDHKGRFLVVSSAFNNLWDLNEGDIHVNSMQQTLSQMQHLLMGETEVSLDLTQHMDTLKKSKDILYFKDGRIIERKSTAYIYEGNIKGRCWSFNDITKQKILIERLGKLAFRDSLTKLYNRRWCEKKLKQLLKSSKTQSLSFFYMDLDHFKVINDSCGHIHGDDVLEEISRLLLMSVGQEAYLSRLGGDEFGLILVNKSTSQVMQIAHDIRSAVTSYSYQWKEKLFKIGVSIGVVFVNKEDDFRSVFVHADEACYVSKESGRNKCTVYNVTKAVFQKAQTDLKWYDAIQKALLKGKFELWCQSVNASDNVEHSYEVLLRMKTENDELISPALFMESADRFGMIFTIDKRVIDSFCRFYHDNRKALRDTMFAINISGHSLSREGLLPFVLNCLQKYSVDCSKLCFEITESEIIKNMDKALLFIKQVRKLGCRIALDDFGKGLTSFSYLKNIPFDYIKIDGQFIKELNEDKINKAVIKSIVYIAEVMEKKTIAEHIESRKMLKQISALGVNYFQGNYFSKPHQITKLLE